jgi:hypothetical protein
MQNDLVPAFMKVAFIREFGAKERRSNGLPHCLTYMGAPPWAHTMGLSPEGHNFGSAYDASRGCRRPL